MPRNHPGRRFVRHHDGATASRQSLRRHPARTPEPSIDPTPATTVAPDGHGHGHNPDPDPDHGRRRRPFDKPLLFLDVDGVLNPVCPRPAAEFTTHRIHGSAVLVSARHGGWLRELSAVYELVWASTWEAQANLCIAPLLGLPALPFVPVGRHPAGDWAPIVRHAAGRPFAWLDDLIPAAVQASCAARVDRLVLPVDPGQGLRRPHVDRLLREPPAPVSFPQRG
ncbi:HAD domain-containing protein [Streptacidiphilus cavernicola]|uniref:HAD domain-containing protein n=1 Tax=Streptacidiphilus cavernicola TaxID=3342716 RepID=A0ABV6W4Q5_9ACTN